MPVDCSVDAREAGFFLRDSISCLWLDRASATRKSSRNPIVRRKPLLAGHSFQVHLKLVRQFNGPTHTSFLNTASTLRTALWRNAQSPVAHVGGGRTGWTN